jgi:hypothetical protein
MNINNYLIESLKDYFDFYKFPHYCPQPSIISMLVMSIRYYAASKNFNLTKNDGLLASFYNKHINERAFILGNGPSLRKCNLEKLKKEITFGVNSIYLNYENMGYYPSYYVIEDPLVAEDRRDEINSYKGAIKFIGNALNYSLNDTSTTVWMNVLYRYDEYHNFPYFSKNALRKIWVGGTVSYLCMQLAYYMGFKEVILLGFDHSYELPEDSIVDGNRILSQSDDPNHFHPDYFGKGYRWHDPNLNRMEMAYKKARDVFEEEGRQIINATVGGKLEVFNRVNFDDLEFN